MSDSETRMREDRALRDAAFALLKADIAQVQATFSGKSLAQRAAGRISEGAQDLLDEAVESADNHRGALAALIAAVVLWFARNPIMALFSDDQAEPGDNEASNNASQQEAQPTDDE